MEDVTLFECLVAIKHTLLEVFRARLADKWDSLSEAMAPCFNSKRGKEVKIMNYTKPEVTVLGNAVQSIQSLGKASGPVDSTIGDATPSYDLDE